MRIIDRAFIETFREWLTHLNAVDSNPGPLVPHGKINFAILRQAMHEIVQFLKSLQKLAAEMLRVDMENRPALLDPGQGEAIAVDFNQ